MASDERGQSREGKTSRKRSKHQRSLAARILRVVGFVLAVPLVLVALLLGFLHSGPGQRLLRDRVVSRVAERLNGTITVGALDLTLFGELALRDVSISDDEGTEVVSLTTLEVLPRWSTLLGDAPVIERVTLDGVELRIVQHEDGSSNLKKLIKPRPPEPPPAEPPKKRDRRVQVESLHIGSVGVEIHKPDGTVIALREFALDATIDTTPTQKTAKVVIPRITAGFALDKPAQGLSVSVDHIVTGLELDVTEGAGTLKLSPTTAAATVRQQGAPDRDIPLDIAGVTLAVHPGEVSAAVDGLMVGALALSSLEVTGRVAEGGLSGEQSVQLLGLKLDHEKLNTLIGRPVLASDIGLETRIAGPPGALVISTAITTAGGDIELGGDVDVSDVGEPEFDLRLRAMGLATEKLLASDKVPPILIEAFDLGLRGHGRSKEKLEADIGLVLTNVEVKGHRVDELRLDARFDGGELELDPLTVAAYGTRLIARGKVDVIRKRIDVTLTIEGDVGATLERLRGAGLAIKTQLPKGAVRLEEDVVTVNVRGDLEGLLDAHVVIDRLAIAGGAISADVQAKLFRNVEALPNEKKVELLDLDGTIELAAVNLKHALALRGKKLDGLTGQVSGKITFEDVPREPVARYRLTVEAQPSERYALDRLKPLLSASIWGHATERDAWVHLDVDGREGKEKDDILRAFAHAPLLISDDYKGIAPYRKLRVKLDLPERKVRDLLAYVPPKLLLDKKTGKPRAIPDGTVFAHIDIGGTGAAPEGEIDIDVQVPLLQDKMQRVKLDGAIDSGRSSAGPLRGGEVALTTALGVWLDAGKPEAVKGEARAVLSRSPLLPGPRSLSWSLDLDVLPQVIGELPLPPEKISGYAGTASGKIRLAGNRADVTGSVDVKVDGLLARGKGPFNLGLGVAIEEDKVVLDVDAGAGKNTLVKVDGTIARGGKGLVAALGDKTPGKSTVDKLGNPQLDVVVELPDQPTMAYGALSPILYSLEGRLGGKVVVSGNLSEPLAEGAFAYHDFQTLSGKPGRATVGLAVTADTVGAVVEIGPKTDKDQVAVAIDVSVPRARIKTFSDAKKCHADAAAPQPTTEAPASPCSEDAKLPITASIAAENVDLKDLIPAYTVDDAEVAFDGRLTWKLAAEVILDPKPRVGADGRPKSAVSPESQIAGELKLFDGVFTIPGTKRQYKDILVAISHDMKAVRVDAIRLRESDLEKPERKLDVRAHLALNDLAPGRLTAHLAARDWLVFGAATVGPADAPRASLSTDIVVQGNVGKPIKTIDVEVKTLELLIPDRFDRAHQPEVVSTGDVIYLKKGMTPGKLPVPLKALDTEAEDPFAEEKEKQEKGPETGLDVTVRIPNKVHVEQFPMNLYPVGGLTIKRRGNNRTIDGKLDMLGGDLSLGGRKHELVRGHILFDEKCSGGCMDLLFARRAEATTLRDVSNESGGDTVTIHMQGPLNARVTTLGGAGSPGTLFDLLSMHNAGRPRYVSEPDLPATMATEFPQHNNLLMLSYFAVNAPHLLFLDRVAAWSDVYDGRGTSDYGQHRHYRAEGYYLEDTLRVRGAMRPPTVGQSEGELGFDYMFSNTPQTAFGIGVTVGTRGGGGPGVFFEWSSKD